MPACAVNDFLELGVGGARYRDPDVGGHSLLRLQAKSVFYRDPSDRWSAGAVAGVQRDGGHESRSSFVHDAAALGLVSFNALDNALRIHANAGVVYRRSEYTTPAWGTAIEYDLRDDWTLLAELYRDAPGRPNYQLGVRYLLVTDRVELFASGGSRLGIAAIRGSRSSAHASRPGSSSSRGFTPPAAARARPCVRPDRRTTRSGRSRIPRSCRRPLRRLRGPVRARRRDHPRSG